MQLGNFEMDGPLFFFACILTATLAIFGTLYAVARDTKPDRVEARYRRERFLNFR